MGQRHDRYIRHDITLRDAGEGQGREDSDIRTVRVRPQRRRGHALPKCKTS